MVDTHVHFNNDDLAADLPDVLARARQVGVDTFVCIGYDLASSERAVAVTEREPSVWAAVGIHPHDATNWNSGTQARLRDLLPHPRVVALGEIGLDYYRDLSPRDWQHTAFTEQLAMAREHNLPVVIHCRDAYPDTLTILEEQAGDIPVILHCWQGSRADAEWVWNRGWFLGIGGAVTYKANDELRLAVKNAPAECLLLETDAPYLSPVPFRGKYPNEPSRIPLIAQTIATVRGESVDAVAAYTTANVARAFPRMVVP